jgi:hypothetical protein
MTINNVFLFFRAPKPWLLVRRTAAATQHKTKKQHEQLLVQPLACIRVVLLVHILSVVVVQDELQITLDPRPWMLGHALSFSITHSQKEMAYLYMLCSYFWKT